LLVYGKELLLEGADVDKPPTLILLVLLIEGFRSLVISPLPSKLNVRFTLNSDVVIAAAVVIVVVVIASFVVKLFVFVNNDKCFLSSFVFKRELIGVVANIEEMEFFSLCKVFSEEVDVIDV